MKYYSRKDKKEKISDVPTMSGPFCDKSRTMMTYRKVRVRIPHIDDVCGSFFILLL